MWDEPHVILGVCMSCMQLHEITWDLPFVCWCACNHVWNRVRWCIRSQHTIMWASWTRPYTLTWDHTRLYVITWDHMREITQDHVRWYEINEIRWDDVTSHHMRSCATTQNHTRSCEVMRGHMRSCEVITQIKYVHRFDHTRLHVISLHVASCSRWCGITWNRTGDHRRLSRENMWHYMRL